MYATTILYARVSSTKQDTLSQWPKLREWAAKEGVHTMEVEDCGTGKNMKRHGIQKIIKGVKAGEVRRVVVVSINRVGRNLSQCVEFFDLCHKHGVELLSLREKVDLSSPMGRCLVNLLSCLAELENEQRSTATKDGQAAKRAWCEANGIPYRANGNRKGYSTKVTPEIAETIHYWRKKGKKYAAIARLVAVSDKTVREVCQNPRAEYISRAELAKRMKGK